MKETKKIEKNRMQRFVFIFYFYFLVSLLILLCGFEGMLLSASQNESVERSAGLIYPPSCAEQSAPFDDEADIKQLAL